MDIELEKYILNHIEPEGDYLYRLYRATNIHTIHGRMASGHLQGRLLKMLVMMQRPRYVLEVGTFSGYSAICMAEGSFHRFPHWRRPCGGTTLRSAFRHGFCRWRQTPLCRGLQQAATNYVKRCHYAGRQHLVGWARSG